MRRGPWLISIAALLFAGLVDVLLDEVHYFPGYAAAIGFFGCIVLTLAAQHGLKPLFKRREDFYPSDTPPDDLEDLRG